MAVISKITSGGANYDIRDRVALINGAGAHNGIYRGISLGTSVSTAQFAAISAGTFEDMYIGDYWTINGTVWRIAAFDYYYNTGDSPACTTHHVVVVPDVLYSGSTVVSAHMNATNTTEGGYAGCAMRAAGGGLATAKTLIEAAFGASHILAHKELITTTVSSGKPTAGAWYECAIELMSEANVYGGFFFVGGSDGTTIPYIYSIDKSQYPLFAMNPQLISAARVSYWLRDVVSAANFALVYGYGYAYANNASYVIGVRPRFLLKS